jgi:autotransporter-associated beta strand protein
MAWKPRGRSKPLPGRVSLLVVAVCLALAAPAPALVELPNTTSYPNSEGMAVPAGLDASVVGEYSSNASFVVIAPNYILTTCHQGGNDPGTPLWLNINGTLTEFKTGTYYTNASADIRVIQILNWSDGTPANLQHYVAPYTGTSEVNKTAVLSGFGKGRDDSQQVPNGYGWAGSSNTTQRWGYNLIESTYRGVTPKDTNYVSDVIVAYFDNYTAANHKDYEAAIAQWDSGGGWFVDTTGNGNWRLVGLSAYVEHSGQSWYQGNPVGDLNPDGHPADYEMAIRVSTYAGWINGYLHPCTWTATGSGTLQWASASNWASGTVANANGNWANFGNTNPSAQTVQVGSSGEILGTLVFNSSSAYTITPYLTSGLTSGLSFSTGSSAVIEVDATYGNAVHEIKAPVYLYAPLLVNANQSPNTEFRISGAISNPGPNSYSVTKNGQGTVVLSASNSFSGGLIINQGTLRATHSAALGGGSGAVTLNGGTLELNRPAATTFNNDLTVGGSAGVTVTGSGVSQTMTLRSLAVAGDYTLTVAGSNGYGLAVSGASTLTGLSTVGATINTSSASAALNGGLTMLSGHLTKTGPNALTLAGTQSYGVGTVLNVNGGTLNLNSDAGGTSGNRNLMINVNGAAASLGASQNLAGLNITGSGVVQMVSAGTRTLITDSLTLDPVHSRLDLADNTLIINYSGASPVAQITQWVAASFDGGCWDGKVGITSSTAAADPTLLHGLAVYDNNYEGVPILSSFRGVTLGANCVLVAYTWLADLNLDGKVDGADYNAIDTGAGMGLTGWQNGDLNFDGKIDGADYNVIDTVAGLLGEGGTAQQLLAEMLLNGTPTLSPAQDAGLSSSGGAVPDPATLTLLALGVLGLAARRKEGRLNPQRAA